MTGPADTRARLLAMTRCQHENRAGGNDYILCSDCGLMWDYRKEQPSDVLVQLLVAEVQGVPPAQPEKAGGRLRQWLGHHDDCALSRMHPLGTTCTCGLNEALSAATLPPSREEPQRTFVCPYEACVWPACQGDDVNRPLCDIAERATRYFREEADRERAAVLRAGARDEESQNARVDLDSDRAVVGQGDRDAADAGRGAPGGDRRAGRVRRSDGDGGDGLPDAPPDQAAEAETEEVVDRAGARGAQEPQLFIDLDGVLADFDRFYEQQFGVKLDRNAKDPPGMWDHIERHGSFYADLPMMPDARELWEGAKRLHPHPIILTGVPHSITDVERHKREWVARHIDPSATVVCCASKDKRLHGKPGDILVDDWHRYRALWEEMGGVFILHTSAKDSLSRVSALLAPAPLAAGGPPVEPQ